MTGLLVDTHVILWHALGDHRLGPAPTARIEAADSEVFVSAASLWEIAIKRALGKLRAPDDLPARLPKLGFQLLAIEAQHAWAVRELPQHHRDPFDRLLIAQAQVESMPIVTADPAFTAYEVAVLWD